MPNIQQFLDSKPRVPGVRQAAKTGGYGLASQALKGPWKPAKIPVLAAYLKTIHRSLGLLMKASGRDRYYFPLIAPRADHHAVVAAELPDLFAVNFGEQMLVCRALENAGRGQMNRCIHELVDSSRLASLMDQRPEPVSRLIAGRMQSRVNGAVVALVAHDRLTTKQSRRLLVGLESVPPRRSIMATITAGSRENVLDVVCHIAFRQPGYFASVAELKPLAGPKPAAGFNTIDWNVVLERTNQWFDRYAHVVAQPNWNARLEALRAVHSRLRRFASKVRARMAAAGGSLRDRAVRLAAAVQGVMPVKFNFNRRPGEPVAHYSRRVADVLDLIFFPGVPNAFIRPMGERQEMATTALALRVYQLTHGHFPVSLNRLVPAFVKAMPMDGYSGKPLLYHRVGKGFVLAHAAGGVRHRSGQRHHHLARITVGK